MVRPQIDLEKCDGCGLCTSICGGWVLVDGVVIIEETIDCDWCTLCEVICPRGAIRCSFEIVVEG